MNVDEMTRYDTHNSGGGSRTVYYYYYHGAEYERYIRVAWTEHRDTGREMDGWLSSKHLGRTV